MHKERSEWCWLPFILSITNGKTAKIRDLPYPVGNDTNESCPWQKDFIASYCLSLNTNPISFDTSFIALSTSINTVSTFRFTKLCGNSHTAPLRNQDLIFDETRGCNIGWRANDETRHHSHLSMSLFCPLTPIRSHA